MSTVQQAMLSLASHREHFTRQEGPSVRWADVHGNRLYMGLEDPTELHVNGKTLSTTNLTPSIF